MIGVHVTTRAFPGYLKKSHDSCVTVERQITPENTTHYYMYILNMHILQYTVRVTGSNSAKVFNLVFKYII